MTAQPPPLPARTFLANLAIVFGSIALIYAADAALARVEYRESRAQANHLFAEGQALLAAGRPRAASDKFGDAFAMQRGNEEFARAQAQAQMAAGEDAAAGETLSALLAADSTDGAANLLMARVLVKQGRAAESPAYFHRAIYGVWPQDAARNQRQARLELIDLLAAQNAREDLLAELLPLQADPPKDLPSRLRLAGLLLQAGAPARSAEAYRAILKDEPSNAAALLGEGKSEFELGEYRQAQRRFQDALSVSPSEPAARHWLELCNTLFALDPTLRGLSVAERWHRSVTLLQMLAGDAAGCPIDHIESLKRQAALAAQANVRPAQQSEAAERNLDLAEQLWEARKKNCQPAPSSDSELSLLMSRFAR